MAAGRKHKIGLDYFELDCVLDNKFKLIQAEYGLKGFAIVVKLFQKIYGECGYYCEFDDDALLLFASENGMKSESEKTLIKEVITCCIRRGIFSEDIYQKYKVLTSHGVQKRYLEATTKRDLIKMKKEYLLLSEPNFSKNVVVSSISDDINSINSVKNTQSRVEKSRVEKSSVVGTLDAEINQDTHTPCTKEMIDKLTAKYGIEFVMQRIERAKKYANANMDTVAKWCKEDYEHNSKAAGAGTAKSKNTFNNYQQRSYDFDALEKQLLGRG